MPVLKSRAKERAEVFNHYYPPGSLCEIKTATNPTMDTPWTAVKVAGPAYATDQAHVVAPFYNPAWEGAKLFCVEEGYCRYSVPVFKLDQPYASMLVSGLIDVCLHGTEVKTRGEVLVTAWDPGDKSSGTMHRDALNWLRSMPELPSYSAIGLANIIDCTKYSAYLATRAKMPWNENLRFLWAVRFGKFRAFDNPFPMRGEGAPELRRGRMPNAWPRDLIIKATDDSWKEL